MYTIGAGRRIVGMQVPLQTLSKSSAEPWERDASVADMGRAAHVADAAGFDYLAVCDHVAIPEAVVEHNSTQWVDPISTLGWIAAQTERARLLTHVYVVPFRHPRLAAKQFVTLDWLSGGRLICGVGVGHMVEEFAGLGVDYSRRGELTTDGIVALTELLENEWVDGLGVGPRPVQTPRPPIWVAGSSPAAVRRAARLGEGWLPQGPATPELIDVLHAARQEAGRDGDFAIGHIVGPVYVGQPTWDVGPNTLVGSGSSLAEQIRGSVPDEVNQFQVRFKARSIDELCDQIEAFAADVMQLVRDGY